MKFVTEPYNPDDINIIDDQEYVFTVPESGVYRLTMFADGKDGTRFGIFKDSDVEMLNNGEINMSELLERELTSDTHA